MSQYPAHRTFPSVDELIDTDDTPVDNEDQNLIPNLLLTTLLIRWGQRQDWFFGVDMAIFHPFKDQPRDPIVPDGFLALGVNRRPDASGRRSYRVWEEHQVPQFVLEMVSQNYNREYDEKMGEYARLGVRYYAVYLPSPLKYKDHEVLEVYRLEDSGYVWLPGDPVWMEEIGLGIGQAEIQLAGIQYSCLLWHSKAGEPYDPPTVELQKMAEQLHQQKQRAEQAEQQLELERQTNQQLRDYLRSLGLDPDNLN